MGQGLAATLASTDRHQYDPGIVANEPDLSLGIACGGGGDRYPVGAHLDPRPGQLRQVLIGGRTGGVCFGLPMAAAAQGRVTAKAKYGY